MLTTALYPGCEVRGPYFDKEIGRFTIKIFRGKEQIVHMRLARFKMQEHLGRLLDEDEHVDHMDENKVNDDIDNLQILSQAENNDKSKRKFPKQKEYECLHCGNKFIMTNRQQCRWEANFRHRQSEGPFCTRSCAAKFRHENRR